MKKPLITFEKFTNKKGEHQWRAVHRNGNIVAGNLEGIVNKKDLNRSMNNFIKSIQTDNFTIVNIPKKK